MVISNSDRSMFKNCRRKWDLGSPNRQNYRSVKKAKPLWLGSLVHVCLELYYGGVHENAFVAFMEEGRKIPKQERDDFAAELFMAGNMLRHYSMVYPSLLSEPFTVLAVELPFQIPLNEEGDVFAGTIDGVIRWKDTGKVGILEHKTFSMHKNEELHDIDDQTAIYPPALNMLIEQGMVPGTTVDDFCDTVLYNGLWKKIPGSANGELKFLKNGELSKSSLGSLTPQWLRHGEKIAEQEVDLPLDTILQMEHNVARYFPRREIFRGKREQELAVNRLLAEFKQMKETEKLPFNDPAFTHNPTNECAWKCPFIPICGALNCGADTEAILEGAYEKAPSRGTAYENDKE